MRAWIFAAFVLVVGSPLAGCSNGGSSPAKVEPSGSCVLEDGICVAKGAGIDCCAHTGSVYDEASACVQATGGSPAIACTTVPAGTVCTANGAIGCLIANGAAGRAVYRTPSTWSLPGFESCDDALSAQVASAPFCAVDGGVLPDAGDAGDGGSPCNVLATSGKCPEGCTPIEGIPYDGEKKCLAPTKVVACTDPSTEPGEYACRVEIATGRPWWFIGGVAPTAPAYPGWRECTAAEASCFPAKPCP